LNKIACDNLDGALLEYSEFCYIIVESLWQFEFLGILSVLLDLKLIGSRTVLLVDY
jgi:hypothetical protein